VITFIGVHVKSAGTGLLTQLWKVVVPFAVDHSLRGGNDGVGSLCPDLPLAFIGPSAGIV
jgi:hypothetical protein